jgi:hypothetical protein
MRIPAESGHHSGGKAATIPAEKRPPFRREFGQHSDLIPATIPEQFGQCKMRV